MKEFMMIFIGGDYESEDMSPEDIQAKMELWNKWIAELREDELFLDGRALKNNSKHIHGNEDRIVTDGPFVEAKELVTGYIVLKARDLDHVTELTAGYPDYDLGGKVEIREIQTF